MIRRLIFLLTLTAACGLATGKDITVAQDGAGDFKTVQEAIDSIPSKNAKRIVIHIKPGTYKERVRLPKDKPLVTFLGDEGAAEKTVLTWNYSAKSKETGSDKEVGTSGSYSTLIESDDFVAQNITFENSAGEVGQAVALRTTGDRAVFRNCRMIGWQDTLYTHGTGRAYFVDCYVEGRVDFIFGKSTAVLENCHIHSKNGGFVTAAATPKESPFGYVFIHCKLTGDTPNSTCLGRPWRPDAAVAYIECEMGDHIKPQGWSDWGGNENHKTARYSEYKSTGPGANPEKRLAWSKQLTDDEAKQYTVENVLRGNDDWDPRHL